MPLDEQCQTDSAGREAGASRTGVPKPEPGNEKTRRAFSRVASCAPFGAEYGWSPRWGRFSGRLIRLLGVLDLPTRLRARLLWPYIRAIEPRDSLDIGFGCGHWSFRLARHTWSRRIVAVDPIATRADEGRTVAARLGIDGIEFRTGHVPAVIDDLSEESLDLVLAVEVLHCVGPLDELMIRIGKLLRPGGRLVVHVPAIGYLRPHEQHLLDAAQLRQLCEAGGLKILHASRTFGPFHRLLFRVFGTLAGHSKLLAAGAFGFLYALTWLARIESAAGDHLYVVAERPVEP
jgi:SAM-dependent methyltransferase